MSRRLDARGREARARALQAVDDAVTQGMTSLGFPRAPIRSLLLVTTSPPGIAGQKYSTCDLQIGQATLRRELAPAGAPDAIVETWIHESIHGRQVPWGPNARTELGFLGFEEGLAEGITRLVSRQAGLRPGLQAYGRYVQTYEELAHVLGTHPETIYRRLYRLANGSVMDGFVAEIDAIRRSIGMPPMSPEQHGRLERTARRLFALTYERAPASARLQTPIRRAWRRAFL